MEQGRRKEYQKDPIKENALEHMNNGLFELEKKLVQSNERPELPIIFIVGAQRSGTTLLMQLIAAAFNVSYPNNLISRFWKAPYIGAALYQSLPVREDSKFTSDLGYTDGVSGPHEFGYFWKRWFPWEPDEHFDYDSIDYGLLKRELAAWQELTGLPLVFKNLVQVTGHLEKLHELFPNAYFINIQRDPVFTIQSTYLSKRKLFSSDDTLFGVKPKCFQELLSLPIEQQIAGQVFHVRKEIKEQLNQIGAQRVLNLSYEELVVAPGEALRKIESSALKGFENELDSEIPDQMVNTNEIKVEPELFELFRLEYQKLVHKRKED